MTGKKRRQRVARVATLLAALTLLGATVACSSTGFNLPGFTPRYGLTISSTIGGTVITPGEGLFYYPQGSTVTVVAQPERGYRFVCWVGNVAAIANPQSATTTVRVDYHSFLMAKFDD